MHIQHVQRQTPRRVKYWAAARCTRQARTRQAHTRQAQAHRGIYDAIVPAVSAGVWSVEGSGVLFIYQWVRGVCTYETHVVTFVPNAVSLAYARFLPLEQGAVHFIIQWHTSLGFIVVITLLACVARSFFGEACTVVTLTAFRVKVFVQACS